MPYRRDADPSPLRTGLVHAGLCLLVFGGLAGALGAGIQFSGDPSAAGPRQQLALFEVIDEGKPELKTRLKTDGTDMAMLPPVDTDGYAEVESGDEPSLDVAYAEGAEATGTGGPSDDVMADGEGVGVRINGKLVKPGESYGEVTKIASLDDAPI